MKAIILAAGRGKRMGKLTEELPKPLLEVGGRTILGYIIDTLPPVVDEIIIVIGYLGEKIREYCQKHYPDKKIIFVVQKELNGTAEAVLLTRPYFQEKERFAIIYGDERASKEQMKKCFEKEFSWLCREMSNPKQSGIATLTPDGRIIEVIEKPEHPKSNMAAAGVMVVNTDLFKYKPERHQNGEYFVTSMMDGFLKDHSVYAVSGIKDLSFSYSEDIDKFNQNNLE